MPPDDRTISAQPSAPSRLYRDLVLTALLLSTAACGLQQDLDVKGNLAEVGYTVAHPATVPFTTELPGRTSAFRTAEVRPQVSGVIQRRLFKEGSLVRKGQPLYQIDPSLYRAAADQAAANLASAQATAEAAEARADRYRPLAEIEAVAQQDYTDAAAAAREARAAVAQSRAALNTARINLRYTTVPAPISGRIGRSLFTEGALVTGSQTDPLAVIANLDRIYVDIQQSSSQLLRLRRLFSAGSATQMRMDIRLKLEDGSEYDHAGKLEFSEVTVVPTTGTITLRARFPNPDGLLLPGMFVRASFAQASMVKSFLVPQPALIRDPKGIAHVYIIGPGNKAVLRTVTANRTAGSDWIVTEGLHDGDRIITQGLGRLKPDQEVKPVPEKTTQLIGNPSRQASSGTDKAG